MKDFGAVEAVVGKFLTDAVQLACLATQLIGHGAVSQLPILIYQQEGPPTM